MSTNDALKMLYKECQKLDLDEATQLILEEEQEFFSWLVTSFFSRGRKR
jgi:hypothetical protein